MALTKRGQYYYGDTQADLHVELARFSAKNAYPIDYFVDCVCKCGHTQFEFYVDESAGVAGRVCSKCRHQHTMADGAQYLKDADPQGIACFCDTEAFEVTAGVHVYRDAGDVLSDHVRWFYVGLRCPECGLLGCYGDWKNEYQPVEELLKMM